MDSDSMIRSSRDEKIVCLKMTEFIVNYFNNTEECDEFEETSVTKKLDDEKMFGDDDDIYVVILYLNDFVRKCLLDGSTERITSLLDILVYKRVSITVYLKCTTDGKLYRHDNYFELNLIDILKNLEFCIPNVDVMDCACTILLGLTFVDDEFIRHISELFRELEIDTKLVKRVMFDRCKSTVHSILYEDERSYHCLNCIETTNDLTDLYYNLKSATSEIRSFTCVRKVLKSIEKYDRKTSIDVKLPDVSLV